MLRSYAERQAHASVDWEMDETSPSLREVEQDVQQSGDPQSFGLPGVFEAAQILPPSQPVAHSQPFWDLDLQDANWLRNNLQQRLGMVSLSRIWLILL